MLYQAHFFIFLIFVHIDPDIICISTLSIDQYSVKILRNFVDEFNASLQILIYWLSASDTFITCLLALLSYGMSGT